MCVCFFCQNILLSVFQLKAYLPNSLWCCCHPKFSDPFYPLCFSLLLIPCEINRNCLLSQHENHLTGVYPETPFDACQPAGSGARGGKEPSRQTQGARFPSAPHTGRQDGPFALCTQHAVQGGLKTSHSVEERRADNSGSHLLLGNPQSVSGSHQMPADYRE